MELILYKTNDNDNVLNKKYDEVYRLNINLKRNTDIINPRIMLNDLGNMDFKKCNYAYIKELDRFYFIKTIESITNHVWDLFLECDVLETYSDDILESMATYQRQIKDGDYQNINNDYDVKTEITIHKSDVVLSSDKSIILTTIGGGE